MAVALFLSARPALAYVGPGAGIAFVTTAFTLLTSFLAAIVLLLTWPFRQLYRLARRKKPEGTARIRRAVIIGLDGLDPVLVRRFMAEGKLPFLSKLAARGGFDELATTFPAMSPVAWSTFATGVNPGKHGIYDFLTRDPKTYAPYLSSSDVGPPAKHIALGRYRIPIGAPQVKLLRKSIPFWTILSRYQVPCSILRVPITFPPEHFSGTMLSAMCVPDMRGTQGSYTYFSSAEAVHDGAVHDHDGGGQTVRIAPEATGADRVRVRAALAGSESPILPGKTLEAPFTLDVERSKGRATIHISGRDHALEVGRYSEWIEVDFPMGLGMKVSGICRFRLLETSPEVRLYASPVNIDPANPVLPISHPGIFSVFLSKLIGRFATLGLAEDTWALNEGVLDEKAFLEQVDDIHGERERMFFEMLARTKRGVLACVFDSTDRVQHMFTRFLDTDSEHRDVIRDVYARMDAMVGRVLEKVDADDPDNLVVVMSDHGFKSFRRGVNVNSWLLKEGYLALKEGATRSGEWFEAVDWERTRAFALGLGGIWLNVRGREAKGVVAPEGAAALREELCRKLTGLVDTGTGDVAVREAYGADALYRGPYRDQAPDIVVGYAEGYRASWKGVQGHVDDVVFDDNDKAWSGDHCIDPALVPGVLITNQRLVPEGRAPAIADLAPTLLDLFGVKVPRHVDGRSLVVG